MDEKEFKKRTKNFAIGVIRLVEKLPHGKTAEIIGRQLIRSGTSVGANYRAACRSRSPADMIAKLKHVEEESDESIYWMELLLETELATSEETNGLMREANAILAMTIASIKTLRAKLQKS